MAAQRCRGIPLERVSGGALARMWSDPSIGALAAPGGSVRAAAARELGTRRRLGDIAGMAGDESGDRLLRRVVLVSLLDGARPSGIPEWVSPVAPVVTQAAVGAGHWAAGSGPWPRGQALLASRWWRGAARSESEGTPWILAFHHTRIPKFSAR